MQFTVRYLYLEHYNTFALSKLRHTQIKDFKTSIVTLYRPTFYSIDSNDLTFIS